MAKRLTRAEVPVEQTWDLRDMFATPQAWEAEYDAVGNNIGSVTKYRGRLGESGATLLACLIAQEDLTKQLMRVGSYASFNQSTDGTDPANQAMAGRVASLMARVRAETSFIQSEILQLPDGTLERFMSEEPGLAEFRRMLEKILDDKKHALSPETERALASLGEVLNAPQMIYERSKASDMTFEPVRDAAGVEHPMSFATYENHFERTADTVLRRNAWASFTKSLKAYQNTYAATWATEVKKNVVMARLRGYASATEYLLAPQEISVEVYNNLHDVILKELAPHMRRYAELRKRVLGLDKMLYVDLEAPLDPDFAPATTFEKAGEIILKGLSVLGPEYTKVIETGLKSRWIDWADNIGKSTGAFCSSVYGVHPYILITWTNSMRNALTLGHELGHAGQGVTAQRHNRLSNSRPSMFFIEAPSTINELLIGNMLLDESTDSRMRRWVAMQFLTTYHHNYVRHLIEGELQRRMYAIAEKGQTITAQTLCSVQGDILKEFWGDILELDDGARLTWMRQPHYYMGLYPYSYSAGLTIGTVVSQAIRKEGAPAAARWIEVLKAGGTKKPLELAKMAGVDMTDPETIRGAVRYVGTLVDEVVKSF
ncbi:MAG: oligoendopeptidase F [Chloroflexota bacterium]